MTIAEMSRRLEKVNLRKEVAAISRKTSKEVILLNQKQLYDFGIDSLGRKLREYQSKSYAAKKNQRNPGPGFGTPDLNDANSFYSQFVVETGSDKLTITSKDSKTDKLVRRYGKEIFGLTKDNRRVYATGVFYTEVKEYISLNTGLRFK